MGGEFCVLKVLGCCADNDLRRIKQQQGQRAAASWVRILAVILMCSMSYATGYAVQASPFPHIFTQPDNKTEFRGKLVGDDRHAWFETLDGYTILRNMKHCMAKEDDSCWWEYAIRGPSGQLIASGVIVTAAGIENFPAASRPPKHLRPIYQNEP